MIEIEFIKRLDNLLYRIVEHAEGQINKLDYRLDQKPVKPWRLGLHGILRLVYINVLVIAFAGFYIAVERGFIELAHSHSWLVGWSHNARRLIDDSTARTCELFGRFWERMAVDVFGPMTTVAETEG